MNRKERILKYINSSDDFVVNGKRYCENDLYNDVEDLVKVNKKYKEVIEKAIKLIEKIKERRILRLLEMEVLDILKEVE